MANGRTGSRPAGGPQCVHCRGPPELVRRPKHPKAPHGSVAIVCVLPGMCSPLQAPSTRRGCRIGPNFVCIAQARLAPPAAKPASGCGRHLPVAAAAQAALVRCQRRRRQRGARHALASAKPAARSARRAAPAVFGPKSAAAFVPEGRHQAAVGAVGAALGPSAAAARRGDPAGAGGGAAAAGGGGQG